MLKTQKFQYLILLGLLFFVFLSPILVTAQNDKPELGSTPETSLICKLTGLTTGDNVTECIRRVYNFAIGISGIVALMVVVFAGYLYMTSGGDGEQLKKSKELIGGVVGGVVILAVAFIVLQFLDPRLVELKEPFKLAPVATTTTPATGGITGGTGPVSATARTALEDAVILAATTGTLDPEWDPTGRVLSTVYNYCRSYSYTIRRGSCFNQEVRKANNISLNALNTLIQADGIAYNFSFSITGWVEGISHTSSSGEHGPASPYCVNTSDTSNTSCGAAIDFNKIDGIDISNGTANKAGVIKFAKYILENLKVRNAYGPMWLIDAPELKTYKDSGQLRYISGEDTHMHVRFQ